MGIIRPLGRSLTPLPDESAAGFLMRLSCRLETSPAEIAIATGLVTPARARNPLPQVLQPPDGVIELFARRIRSTEEEAARMFLTAFAEKYPPASNLPRSYRTSVGSRHNRWLFLHASRFCPVCLAGDGSPVQRAFGGVWKRTWRLPPVFACLVHHRYLAHECPVCHVSALSTNPGTVHGSLPRWRDSGIHPARCRSTNEEGGVRRRSTPEMGCPARFDQVSPPSIVPSVQVEQLQDRLLSLLSPDGPDFVDILGRITPVAHYFNDLRVLCHLFRTSWPACLEFVHDRQLREAAAACELAAEDSPRSATLRSFHDSPLPAAIPCAALLAGADSLLRSIQPRELGTYVKELLSHDPRRPGKADWSRDFLETRPACSDGLLRALAPVLQTYARSRLPRAVKKPIRKVSYRVDNIPQFLQCDWYENYFGGMDGIAVSAIRRTAALRLCQIAVGGSLHNAASMLDFPLTAEGKHRAADGAKRVHQWARQRPDPGEFEEAVHSLADYLDQCDSLIDYRRRRNALRNWCIPENVWREIASRIPEPENAGHRPELGERKRQTASIVVWARLSEGEHVFAPHPIRNRQDPKNRNAWRLSDYAFWARIQQGTTRQVDDQLLALLDQYIAHLAPIIDLEGEVPKESSPWS
ncbi:TniQ protein [Streptomyces mirabilis]|uniref:TniQ protein n=2 Tax=Streptomyces mirabilis TaxID=68239 RepID=A0A1I2X9B0_9ACTN|nr:TniQ protein [Streptomyces mirabilis]